MRKNESLGARKKAEERTKGERERGSEEKDEKKMRVWEQKKAGERTKVEGAEKRERECVCV